MGHDSGRTPEVVSTVSIWKMLLAFSLLIPVLGLYECGKVRKVRGSTARPFQ